jgi:hypothetical protein
MRRRTIGRFAGGKWRRSIGGQQDHSARAQSTDGTRAVFRAPFSQHRGNAPGPREGKVPVRREPAAIRIRGGWTGPASAELPGNARLIAATGDRQRRAGAHTPCRPISTAEHLVVAVCCPAHPRGLASACPRPGAVTGLVVHQRSWTAVIATGAWGCGKVRLPIHIERPRGYRPLCSILIRRTPGHGPRGRSCNRSPIGMIVTRE